MYYIEQQNEYLVKYKVVFDERNLKIIRDQILDKCGEITHRSYDDTNYPNNCDYTHIRNYKQEQIGKTEPRDFYTSSKDIYHFEYDEYQDTKLVKLINKLLQGETSVILELKNPTPEIKEDKIKIILAKIEKTQEELQIESDSNNIKEKINILQKYLAELKEEENKKLLNANRKSDLDYYPEVLKYIILNEVDRIKIDTLLKLNDLYKELEMFFNESSFKNISEDIDNELYKKLIMI